MSPRQLNVHGRGFYTKPLVVEALQHLLDDRKTGGQRVPVHDVSSSVTTGGVPKHFAPGAGVNELRDASGSGTRPGPGGTVLSRPHRIYTARPADTQGPGRE